MEEFDRLPLGQANVIAALLEHDHAPTYQELAELLGLHLGTIHTHLARVRQRHPWLYAEVMIARRRQLAARHVVAVANEAVRSADWHRRRSNRLFYYRFGRWPWERRRTARGQLT